MILRIFHRQSHLQLRYTSHWFQKWIWKWKMDEWRFCTERGIILKQNLTYSEVCGIDIQIWHPCGVSTRNNFLATILSRGSYSWWKPYTDVISVLLDRTNTKHKRGKNYKHQRFWINTRHLPCWTSFTGRSLGKLCRCSGIILRASGDYSTNSWLLPWIIQLFHKLIRTTACH